MLRRQASEHGPDAPATREALSPGELAAAEADAGFAPGEVNRVRVRYHIGSLVRARPLLAGSPLAPKMVLVGSSSGPVVLKRLAPGYDEPAFDHVAHSMHRRLEAHGFPVASLLSTREGGSALRLGGRTFEVSAFVRGGRCDRSAEQTRQAGEALGRYHALLINAHTHLGGIGRSVGEPRTGVYHDDARIRRSLARLPAMLDHPGADELAARLGALYERAAHRARVALEGSEAQIVHGDWHPGNLLYHGGRIVAVLDHESAGLAPCMLDVGNGALQFSIQASGPDPRLWPTQPDARRLAAFLEGVRGGRALAGSPGLSMTAMEALPWLMAEALIAEAAVPIASTGSFHGRDPAAFLRMVARKAQWLADNPARLLEHAGD